MGAHTPLTPVVSKLFCSSLHAVLLVRRRPPTVTGGGFVVTDRMLHMFSTKPVRSRAGSDDRGTGDSGGAR